MGTQMLSWMCSLKKLKLSSVIEGVAWDKIDKVFKELITTVKSTMTDQGPTMPQFNERLHSVRTNLLPEVVENWETLPQFVKESMAEFGAFYCKMHPLVNFAVEINKVLKTFEDFTTSGKYAHADSRGWSNKARSHCKQGLSLSRL